MRNEQGRMQLAVNRAMSIANGTGLREQFARAGMGGSSDTKRPQAWCEYGYPETVTNEALKLIWQRGGIGHGAVEKVIGNCWKTPPTVVEGGRENNAKKESTFEATVGKMATEIGLWNAFKKADRMRLVQRYSAILIFYADDKPWDQPVDTGKKVIKKLKPVWETALQPGGEIDTDMRSANYGWPTSWQYTEVFANGATKGITNIHPDRIFFLGDMESDAVGWLEPVYNDLVSIEKLSGGAGESFLKNAARQVVFSFDPEIDFEDLAATYGVKVSELQKEFNKTSQALNRGIDTAIGLQGATVTPLVAAVADPGPAYNVSIQNVASGLDIPNMILVGKQSGDRASTEDRAYFNSTCQSRREDLSPEITAFLHKIAAAGALELPGEISIAWDDLNESTSGEKLELAFKMMDANSKALDQAAEPFTTAEVRTAAGLEPEKAAP